MENDQETDRPTGSVNSLEHLRLDPAFAPASAVNDAFRAEYRTLINQLYKDARDQEHGAARRVAFWTGQVEAYEKLLKAIERGENLSPFAPQIFALMRDDRYELRMPERKEAPAILRLAEAIAKAATVMVKDHAGC